MPRHSGCTSDLHYSSVFFRPVAGSKSEMRGKRAARHINAEVMLLCDMIHQEGQQLEDGTAVISFGDLFQAGLAGGVERGSRTGAPISLQVSLSRLKCILE